MNCPIDLTGFSLKTERLTLRPFCQSDLDDFFAYASVPGVGERAGWIHHQNKSQSQAILNGFIAGKKTFALVDGEGRVIGSLGIEEYNDLEFPEFDAYSGREIGYVLAKDYWGNGLMSEAVKRVVSFCFDELGMDFLLCAHADFNAPSKRVQEKAGFRHYRRYTGHPYCKEEIVDGWYSLIWNPKKEMPEAIQNAFEGKNGGSVC